MYKGYKKGLAERLALFLFGRGRNWYTKRLKLLMIGDVIGQPGLKALFAGLGPSSDRRGPIS